MPQTEWFKSWFDSPYYFILYRKRDYDEAKAFISELLEFLKPEKNDKILDLACGKGRHSIYLNELGYDITGVDLAANSISHAKQYENERLHFEVHDMREVFRANYFDYVFNLFTSFGYFESIKENVVSLASAARNLKKGGFLVIDFMNPSYVLKNLVKSEQIEREGILFKIKRSYDDDFVFKKIKVIDEDRTYSFQEKVRLISLHQFKHYFKSTGLNLVDVFGDYSLNSFEESSSPRMVMITRCFG